MSLFGQVRSSEIRLRRQVYLNLLHLPVSSVGLWLNLDQRIRKPTSRSILLEFLW